MNAIVGKWYRPAAIIAVAALLAWAVTPRAAALYMKPDLEKIPIERLVKNLQEIADKEPKNTKVRLNLARAHAMAYALKTDTCEALRGKPEEGAWFGFEPKHVPFKNVPTDDKEKLKAAEAHLKKAIEYYEATLKLDEKNLTALLGRAWCIEQSGKKEEAIKAYREVIEKAWEVEKDKKVAGLGWHSVTAEAGSYLVPLLDAQKDKAEIATIKERTEKMNMLPRPITPIAVPLSDGLTIGDIEAPDACVRFDADGSGMAKTWSWITAKAGWLVLDPQRSGKITSALQMFGNVTFWMFWDNGYEALRTLDDNGDGMLVGDELRGLAIWNDINGNGVSDPGEVLPLDAHGIVGLSCRFERDQKHPDRIAFSPAGVRMKDGSTRPSFDVVLKPR